MKEVKRNMKRIISIVLLVFMIVGLCSCGSKKPSSLSDTNGNEIELGLDYENKKLDEGIVAVVGEEEITKEEVRFLMSQYVASIYSNQGLEQAEKAQKDAVLDSQAAEDGSTYRELIYKQAADTLIMLTLFSEKGKEKGIDYTDEKLKEVIETSGITEQKQLFVEQFKLTPESIDEHLRKQYIYSDYMEQYVSKEGRMNPDDETLKTFFNDNFLKAKHILKLTTDEQTGQPLDDKKKSEAKAKIDALLKDARSGADFDKLVADESQDPGSQSQPEGYVFTEGEMVTEFYEGTKALKIDGISDVIETSYGYHVIKRLALSDEDFTANKEKTLSYYQNKEFEKIIEETKKEAKIYLDYEQLLLIEDVLYEKTNLSGEAAQPQEEAVVPEE